MEEKLIFQNSKDQKLVGLLSNPSEDKGKPIVIFCHGFRTSKDSLTYIKIDEAINQNNISIFKFDFFGHGESDGEFADITITEAVDDALCAVRFVRGLGYTKIGLFGSSFGGMIAFLVAAKTPDVFVLALKAPVSNYIDKFTSDLSQEEIESWRTNGSMVTRNKEGKEFPLNYSFFEDAKKYDVYQVAQKISAPTLIVHGDRDQSVSIEQSEKVSGLIPNCQLEVIPGADHFFSKPGDYDKMVRLIAEFILKHATTN